MREDRLAAMPLSATETQDIISQICEHFSPSSMYVENARSWCHITPCQFPWGQDTLRQLPWCHSPLPLDLSKKTGSRPGPDNQASQLNLESASTVASQGNHLANSLISYAKNVPLPTPYGPRDSHISSSPVFLVTPPIPSCGGSPFSPPVPSYGGGSSVFSSFSNCRNSSPSLVQSDMHEDSMNSCASPGTHLQMKLDNVLEDVLDDINNEISLMASSATIPTRKCTSHIPYLYITASNGVTIPAKRQRRGKTEVKKYECPLCGDHLATRSTLRVHIRRHTGQKPYMCSFCSKRFTQRSTMHAHMRMHTNERPYACTACPKTFRDYSTFTNHYRIHTGQRPYKCHVCGKGFVQSGNLKRHLATHY